MSKIEDSVSKKILDRAEIGRKKYGVTMERSDLSAVEWLQHAQEEAMDMAVYLEKIMRIATDGKIYIPRWRTVMMKFYTSKPRSKPSTHIVPVNLDTARRDLGVQVQEHLRALCEYLGEQPTGKCWEPVREQEWLQLLTS